MNIAENDVICKKIEEIRDILNSKNSMLLKDVPKYKQFTFEDSFHDKDEVFECNGLLHDRFDFDGESVMVYDLTKIGKIVDGKIVIGKYSYKEKFRTLASSAGDILKCKLVKSLITE